MENPKNPMSGNMNIRSIPPEQMLGISQFRMEEFLTDKDILPQGQDLYTFLEAVSPEDRNKLLGSYVDMYMQDQANPTSE